MKITRISLLTGIERTMDLPVNQEQINAIVNGALIQKVLPDMSIGQREFLISGITAEEWTTHFPPDEDDYEPVEGDYVPELDYPQ